MTLENCKKYLEEATTEKDKKFWQDRIKRKYPKLTIEVKEDPKEEPKKSKKKDKK
jgi:hypothetical protein